MSVLDNVVLANLRNTAGGRNLNKELRKLDKHHESELRMLQTSEKRFRNKFGKNHTVFSSKKTEASNVRMYETHNPGFCYHKNGACRVTELARKRSETHSFEVLKDMLFSHGELDIEKLVCLHLLESHAVVGVPNSRIHFSSCCESPTLRRKSNLTGTPGSRKQSGALGEENQDGCKLLPKYVIDIQSSSRRKQESKTRGKDDDCRSSSPRRLGSSVSYDEVILTDDLLDEATGTSTDADEESSSEFEMYSEPERQILIYVNNEIECLVDSVLDTLKDSNQNKVKVFLDHVQSPIDLRRLLRKPEMQTFMESLRGKELISGIKSYRCTSAILAKHPRVVDKKKNCSSKQCNEANDIIAVKLIMPNESLTSLGRIIEEIRWNLSEEISGMLRSDLRPPQFRDASSYSGSADSQSSEYRRNSPSIINNSRVALAGSIAGSSMTRMSLTSLGSGYSLTDTKSSKDTMSLVSPSLSHLCAERQHVEIDPTKKAICPDCVDRWKFQKVLDERNPLRDSHETAMLNSAVMDKTKSRMSKVLEKDNWIKDNIIRNIKKSVGMDEKLGSSTLRPSKTRAKKRRERDNELHSVLRKMSNPQRILVGMKAASLKSHEINVNGIEPSVRCPLTQLLAPVLSQDSIIALTSDEYRARDILLTAPTQGEGLLNKSGSVERNGMMSNETMTTADPFFPDCDEIDTETHITHVILAMLKQAIADKETDKKLNDFLKSYTS